MDENKGQTQGQLEVQRDSNTQLSWSRWFDAPPELVYEAMTSAEHIPNWWGMRNSTTVVERLEARVGGKWRFVQREADGKEHAFHGEFLELAPPRRIVQTFIYEPWPQHISHETLELTPNKGGTLARGTSLLPSKESLDAFVESGMEAGMRETYDRLAELLESLQGSPKS